MSYTTLHTVPEKGGIQTYAEFHNSHLWARVYWEWLAAKYLRMTPIQMIGGDGDQIWKLIRDERVSEDERICLGATFDWVMVKKEDIPRLIPAFTRIGNISNNPRWDEMAGALDRLLTSNEEYIAVCWTVTSITDSWEVFEGDDARMYDISRDSKHCFLFDELGKPE